MGEESLFAYMESIQISVEGVSRAHVGGNSHGYFFVVQSLDSEVNIIFDLDGK